MYLQKRPPLFKWLMLKFHPPFIKSTLAPNVFMVLMYIYIHIGCIKVQYFQHKCILCLDATDGDKLFEKCLKNLVLLHLKNAIVSNFVLGMWENNISSKVCQIMEMSTGIRYVAIDYLFLTPTFPKSVNKCAMSRNGLINQFSLKGPKPPFCENLYSNQCKNVKFGYFGPFKSLRSSFKVPTLCPFQK